MKEDKSALLNALLIGLIIFIVVVAIALPGIVFDDTTIKMTVVDMEERYIPGTETKEPRTEYRIKTDKMGWFDWDSQYPYYMLDDGYHCEYVKVNHTYYFHINRITKEIRYASMEVKP